MGSYPIIKKRPSRPIPAQLVLGLPMLGGPRGARS
jgi:hypothetical protein